MENAQIASRLKIRCKACGCTISQMLSDCNVNKNFIYDLEKRDKSPSCDKMYRIADYLDCSVDYLLGRSPTPERDGGSFSPALQQLLDAADGLTDEEIVKSVEYMSFLRACRK